MSRCVYSRDLPGSLERGSDSGLRSEMDQIEDSDSKDDRAEGLEPKQVEPKLGANPDPTAAWHLQYFVHISEA